MVGTAEYQLAPCSATTGQKALALNLPGSTGPKQLDRKADSFVIGPVYSGSGLTRWRPTGDLPEISGMALSKATAISAAAVSPNMGKPFQLRILRFQLGGTLYHSVLKF